MATPPQFAGAAQSALAGMDAPPAAAAPVYQAPPAAAPPTFFGRILQGALNGLAGGLRQGQENVAGAGTPGFHPGGNGLAYAQQLQAGQDQQAREDQAGKVQAAQQQFENQRQTFAANQQAQLQQVQATQAKLSGIHLEQQIQHGDQEAQDNYYKGQQDNMQSILDGGGKEVAHLKVPQGGNMQDVGASYLKDNPTLMADPNTHLTFSRDADGETEVHVMSGDPNAQIDAAHANSQLKSIGSDRQVAPGTSMSRHDFNRVFSEESGKVADQHNAAKVEQLKFQQQQALERQRQAGEFGLEKLKENHEDTSSPVMAKMLVDGDMDPSQLSKKSKDYDAKISAANEYSMQTTGKPFDMAKAQNDYKFATNVQTHNTLNYLDSLAGKDGKSGNLGQVVQLSRTVGNGQFPALNNASQWARLEAGDPKVAAYHAALVEASDQVAKVLQGGGSGGGTSDAKMKQAQELFDKGFNADQMAAVAGTLGTQLSNRKQSMIGDNRYLLRQYGPGPTQSADSQNPSGASQSTQSVPKGMKMQRNKKTGETRLVPE